MIRWDAGDSYAVVFSTRVGGVSEGRFASLNLGRLTGDEVDRVDENRRRLCDEVGGGLDRLALNRQIHSDRVLRAVPGGRGNPGDGLWTDEPDLPILAFAADCLPIALVRSDAAAPAVAVVHAGWRGLLDGVVAAGVSALDTTRTSGLRACVGPAIGPCCYEVGSEVAEPFAAAFGRDVVQGRKLDLRVSADRALRANGVAEIEHVDLCTACNPERFFSHRRTGKPRGVQGVIARVARDSVV
ncbi:MAG: peptidoglycan editing factor PgeF [Gaiellaceae bacterium MAG52_C11]|nr:peptidoglycan editing factor PgeF [Candidatus Gaiellasilicea maunaloa]